MDRQRKIQNATMEICICGLRYMTCDHDRHTRTAAHQRNMLRSKKVVKYLEEALVEQVTVLGR